MKRIAALSALALLGAALTANAPPAGATDISLESRTYMPVRGTKGADTHALLYEYLNFSAEDLALPGLYLRASGWGRTDLADETYGKKTNGDLQYAYLGWRAPLLNAEARVGRISLTAGVARHEVFDGALLGTDLPYGFDATVFGGVPTETDVGGRSSDTLYGGRLSQGQAGLYRLGASYLKEKNDGEVSREEVGADVFVAPVPLVSVTGSSLYNSIAKQWARHDYRLSVGPFVQALRIAATWSSTDYRYYFQSPVHPAFIPEDPDADEKLQKIGGELSVDVGMGFTLAGQYTSYTYDVAGAANAFSADLGWAGSGFTAGGGYRKVHGDEAENQYQEFRAHASAPVGPLGVSLSGQYLKFAEAIDGEDTALTAALDLSYPASPALEFSASVEYGKNPEYSREVKGLLTVLWRYDASMKNGGTK